MNMQQALNNITKNIELTQPQMEDVMRTIMNGEATDAQIGALMMGLRLKGESIDEITAAARVMREFAIKFDVRGPAKSTTLSRRLKAETKVFKT